MPYRRSVFDLKIVKSADPFTGENRVSQANFNLRRVGPNEAVVELAETVKGPQDIELQLDMSIYSSEFASEKEEVFLGTVVAKISIYITKDAWLTTDEQHEKNT